MVEKLKLAITKSAGGRDVEYQIQEGKNKWRSWERVVGYAAVRKVRRGGESCERKE